MKISLIISGARGGFGGGIEQYSNNLIKGIEDKKKIKSINVISKTNLKLKNKKIKTSCAFISNSPASFFLTIIFNIINILKSDIILISHINHIPFLIIPILLNKKVVLLSYGKEIWGQTKNLIYKILIKKINYFICMRQYTMKVLKKKYNLENKNFYLLSNCIKLRKLKKLKINKNKNIITISKLWSILKFSGVDENLEAFSLLKKMNFYYFIVGDGDDKPRLIQKAKKLNIIKNVKFFGKVSNKKRDILLANSSILSMPGTSEWFDTYPFRFAFLEAAEFGLKILGSTPKNEEKHYEKKYKNLNFVNPTNRKKILIKILKLQKQKRQFDKKYLKDFSFDNFKNRLNNILLEIIK